LKLGRAHGFQSMQTAVNIKDLNPDI